MSGRATQFRSCRRQVRVHVFCYSFIILLTCLAVIEICQRTLTKSVVNGPETWDSYVSNLDFGQCITLKSSVEDVELVSATPYQIPENSFHYQTTLDLMTIMAILDFLIKAHRLPWVICRDSRLYHRSVPSRQLKALKNCTPAAIEQFPQGLFTQEERQNGVIVLHFLVAIYMFLALAIVCDEYFVPSLEILSEMLNLQTDVAGATLMAAGSSAPELATSMIGVFVAKNDIGLGTVVGSAVYNIMFVISICALFAGMVVHLNWWPLIRDTMFYCLSVIALILVIMDEIVRWYEALILLGLYLIYIILMYFNPKIEAWMMTKVTFLPTKRPSDNEEIALYTKLANSSQANGDLQSHLFHELDDNSCSDSDLEGNIFIPLRKSNNEKIDKNVERSVFAFPDGWCKRIIWIVSLPVIFLFFITIPDCRKKRHCACTVLTFGLSIVWLSALSFIMVWMITIIGHTLKIPDTVMGLTFVAFGVSLPDVIASFLVVREGLGDMAVSNAIGSNVFDILICLGFPWLLRSLYMGQPITVYSEGMTYSSATLLFTVLFLIVATHVNGWKLDIKYGIVLMLVYVIVTVLQSLYELNIFGYFNPPECPTSY